MFKKFILSFLMMNFLIIGYVEVDAKAMMHPDEVLVQIGERVEQILDQEEQLEEYDRVLEFKSYEKDIGLHINPAEVGQEVIYPVRLLDGEEEIELEMSVTTNLITDDTVYDYLGMNELFTVVDKQNEYEKWVIIDFEINLEDSDADVSHTINADDFDIYFINRPDTRKLEDFVFDEDLFFQSGEITPGDTLEGQIVTMIPNYESVRVRFGTGEGKTHVFWEYEGEVDPNVVY
ncbi:hypothetical protein [Aliicoccus persicus]|uniref:Uncharacterized protein n=2 Tax=Aliicoccus persicus TaxID=930138 RepID=A0A662Z1T3_9STAP|nr:hypothetical protein [Aliicoccus persicus]SEV88268.1 hypothetical protein SAMN05192557_0709 [Aliicoccus persicus]